MGVSFCTSHEGLNCSTSLLIINIPVSSNCVILVNNETLRQKNRRIKWKHLVGKLIWRWLTVGTLVFCIEFYVSLSGKMTQRFYNFSYRTFKKNFIFNWRIIALQYCISVCYTSIWMSHRYTYAPSFSYRTFNRIIL